MDFKIQQLGIKDYVETWQAMQTFTLQRRPDTPDEIWIVEHPAVYTLGLNGKQEHILVPQEDIPIIQSDRGGQVTYHGPGQLLIYTLLDIARLQMGVRQLVSLLELAVIDTLAQYGIKSEARPDAPGVYVNHKKIASVGLRIKKGCSYHGLSINNQMDLTPFKQINTCGYPELEVTQLIEHNINVKSYELAVPIIHSIYQSLINT